MAALGRPGQPAPPYILVSHAAAPSLPGSCVNGSSTSSAAP